VLRANKGLVLCNLRTGAIRGRFPFPAAERSVHQILAGSFRPDGKEFAAILTLGDGRGPSSRRLVRWDATTGKPIDSQPINVTPQSICWCGDDTLMLDWSLFDLMQAVPLCTYEAPGGHTCQDSPDQRFWFTHGADPKAPARLSARTLPDETAKQAAAQLASGEVRLVLKPGMKISVQLDFKGPAEDAGYRQRYEDQL